MIRSRLLFLALILSPFASMAPVHAHGSHGGGSELEAGEFDFTPLLTVEGHAGFDDNLEIPEKHYAADFLIGGEFAWGLGNDKQFSLSAFVGPALVRGGAEHFYGEIHVHDEEEHEAHPTRSRVDFKAYLEANYKHSDRLNVQAYWNPYFVTSDELKFHAEEGEWEKFESKGVKNELGAKVKYAFGDGDVDFGLGDSFSDLIDGAYVSVDHRQGWGVDGVFIGNYTDPRLGVGFNYGEIAFQIEGGPRFYTPGKYASALNSRTDWAGEIMVSRPVSDKVDFFAHWKFIHTWDNAEGWGDGYQHHIGTGITYKL
ncbi:putative conserved secreted protein [Synechococcus sp. TAK9802]|nr:putative conserved secreted protein [Synechococcus sp. TAK9802]